MTKTFDLYSKQPLGRFLSSIGKNFLSTVNKKLRRLDIERSFYALILIEEGKGKITQQDLAGQLDIDKVSVVRIIDYLSGKGYVKRVKNPHDRRKYSLILTEKAKKKLPLIKNALKETTRIAFDRLNSTQIAELYNTLNIIKKNLNESKSCL